MTHLRLESIELELVQDNIADREADVLVNAANDQLQMGGGVAAALRSKGGIGIHQEAIQHAPARIGSVVRTGAGSLSARWVYHAVVIDFETKKGTSAGVVEQVVQAVVGKALADNVERVAMPLFGAGVGGLGVTRSAEAVLRALEHVASGVDRVLHVELVVRDDDEYAEAARAIQAYLPAEDRAAEEDDLAAAFLASLEGD